MHWVAGCHNRKIMIPPSSEDAVPDPASQHRRRLRYKGKNPRDFALKYKEHRGDAETVEKVRMSGKTPAGTHRPVMVGEVLENLSLFPGETVIDCTLGYGGHASEIIKRILPDGRLIGLDTDSVELAKTSSRLCSLEGVEEGNNFFPRHTNYAGIMRVVNELSPGGVNAVLADLGLSSMQIDDPGRGFSYKTDGPLDMRMNKQKGMSARELIRKAKPEKLVHWLRENGDEPFAEEVGMELAGKDFPTTGALVKAIEKLVPEWSLKASLARIFQAVRISVNEEFNALDTLLRVLPDAVAPGGRVVILTFHSGEDRRVKHAFRKGLESGIWSSISDKVQRPSPEEVRENPRSSSTKLRWAIRAGK